MYANINWVMVISAKLWIRGILVSNDTVVKARGTRRKA